MRRVFCPLLTWRNRIVDLLLVASCACIRTRRGI
jgi:hypothetical protein